MNIKATYIAHSSNSKLGINWDDPIAVAQYKKEYYEAHKKNKQRRSTAGLNEEGRNLAEFVREGINSERDQKIESSKAGRDRAITTKRTETDSEIDTKKETKDRDIENHKNQMNKQIDSIRKRLELMRPEDRARHSEEFKAEINRLREVNAQKRAELNAKYQVDREGIQNEYKKERESQYNKHNTNVVTYRQEADDRYMNALDKIKADSRYTTKKKSSGSGGRSAKSSASKEAQSTGRSVVYKPQKQLQRRVMSNIRSRSK